MTAALSRIRMMALLRDLNDEMARLGTGDEVSLVGGAVMCLALEVRMSTRDVDAILYPLSTSREAARRAAAGSGEDIPLDWLNDCAKGFLSPNGTFDDWLEMSSRRIMTACPENLLAMKCMAMRLGPDSHDIADIRFPMGHLGLETSAETQDVVAKYYPFDRIPQRTFYVLEDMFAGNPNQLRDGSSIDGPIPHRDAENEGPDGLR